jgi:hypothetical protein
MQQNRTVGVAEVAECLPSMHEALNHHQKKKKERKKRKKQPYESVLSGIFHLIYLDHS